MRLLTLFILSLMTTQALAHPGHHLEEGLAHNLYHALFIVVAVAAVVQGIRWWRKRAKSNTNSKAD